MLGIANLVCSHHSCIRMLYCLRATWFHPEGCVGVSVLRCPAKGETGVHCVCVCGRAHGTGVLGVVSPTWTATHFAMKSTHFVSCLFCSESKDFVVISRDDNAQV